MNMQIVIGDLGPLTSEESVAEQSEREIIQKFVRRWRK
jgi:hypothetical protein